VARRTVAVLGTRYPDLSIEESILKPEDVDVVSGDGSSRGSILEHAGAAVILAGSGPRFDGATLAELDCVGIVRYGVGVDTIDLAAAAELGKWVAFVPDYGTDSVATHTVTLILAAIRRLPEADASVHAGGWSFHALRPLHLPSALTVGIVGYGRIGHRVAELLAPFGFRLIAFDPIAGFSGDLVEAVEWDRLLTESDIITIHAPGRPDGTPLLGASELGRMKRGVVIVNTARGVLIDADSLADALRARRVSIAALDVWADEPPTSLPSDVIDRMIMTPHMAWYTEESEEDLRIKAVTEALRLLRGDPPLNAAARPEGTS
jgi:D-3-phosphoglycerate dehydrogenase / 2-oxoglutarate reductase